MAQKILYSFSLVITVIGVLAGVFAPINFVAEAPGPTEDVLGYQILDDASASADSTQSQAIIQIDASWSGPIRETDGGHLYLTTVRSYGGPSRYFNLSQALLAHFFDPTHAILPTEMLYGLNPDAEQISQDNEASMVESQHSAVEAALQLLGIPSSQLQISLAIENIGGPSAGLMFALGVVQKIGPNDLVRNRIIAGTGEISASGMVGAIGGINQKISGAQRDGAQMFLLPLENCADLNQASLRLLPLYPVVTLTDAVELLQSTPSVKTLADYANPANASNGLYNTDRIYQDNLTLLSEFCVFNF
jgi:PDZ domain-containing protein